MGMLMFSVHAGQWSVCRGLRTQDDERIMVETFFPKWAIYRRSIRAHRGAGRNVFTHEWYERLDARSLDAAQPDAPESLGLENLNRHRNGNQVGPVAGRALGRRRPFVN